MEENKEKKNHRNPIKYALPIHAVLGPGGHT